MGPPNVFTTFYAPLHFVALPATSSSFIANPDSPTITSDLSISTVPQAPTIARIQPLTPPLLPPGPITPTTVGPPQASSTQANDPDSIVSTIFDMFGEALESPIPPDAPDSIPVSGSPSDDTIYPPRPTLTRSKRARPSDFGNYDSDYVNGAHRYHEGPFSIHDTNERELLNQFDAEELLDQFNADDIFRE